MNHTDLIDRYLRNELTENEKNQFEGLLSASDKSLEGKKLNDEMELQKEIIMAIKARGLKECLQKKEGELRAKRAQKQRRERIIRLSSWSLGGALVAAIAIFAFITTPMTKIMQEESLQHTSSNDFSSIRNIMKQESLQFASSIDFSAVRGGLQAQADSLQSRLLNIYSLIAQEQFDLANKNVKQLLQDLQTNQDITSEEHKEIFHQTQWLYAICEMYQGNVFEAKELLKQIANSDSHYADRAQDILDKL
jgi:hypothetical protein